MTIDEIVTLIQAVSDNGLTSFVLEDGEQKLVLKKKKKKNAAPAPVAPVVISQPAAPMMSAVAMPVAASAEISAQGAGQNGGLSGAQSAAQNAGLEMEVSGSGVEISSDKVVSSPLVGTFYTASSPDAEPFVRVGDTVKKGQVLGIIEAMKLMNEIESEYDGVIEAILVENEGVVEYGQPLFRIR